MDVRWCGAWSLAALALVAGGIAGCDDGAREREDQRRALEQRREQMVIQYASVQNQIRSVQGQALSEPEVIEVQERFYEVLRAKMIELDPQAEALLDRATAVGADLERLSGPVTLQPGEEPPPAGERAAVGRELAELEQAMRAIQSAALEDSAVAATFYELQDAVVAAMVRLDPQSQVVLDRINELEDDIAELDRQIAEVGGED